MRGEVAAVAAALAVQVAVVAAVPLHESWIRANGRTVTVAVDPVDPYEPLRGYHADFTYRGVGPELPGFDKAAPEGAPAWIVLRVGRQDEPARPDRIARRPAAALGAPALRARYAVVERSSCWNELRDAGCRKLELTPNAWYADEQTVAAMGSALRSHQAVAELRVTPDGDASLLRLRPSGAKGGPGG